VATDISPAALAVARRNAVRHGVADRLELREEDLLASAEDFDLIVANPPYVDPADRERLSPEVLHEPALALFSPERGLQHITRLVRAAERTRGAWLLVEIGYGQHDAVRRIVEAGSGWVDVSVSRDLQGIPRTLCARRAEAARAGRM
jgi:release factor glutamine methyltransferase